MQLLTFYTVYMHFVTGPNYVMYISTHNINPTTSWSSFKDLTAVGVS